MARSAARRPIEVEPGDIPLAARRVEHVQGHWLLARLGKRVLRPGGLRLTKPLLREARVTGAHVVEFAPGMGRTATIVLSHDPADYVGVDADPKAAAVIDRLVSAKGRAIAARADASGLPDASADIVLAEGVLTIQSEEVKRSIVAEAARLLRPGGRYVLHELSLKDAAAGKADGIRDALAHAMHVHARPKTIGEWRRLVTECGLEVRFVHTSPLALLEPQRVVADEGFVQAMRFFRNVLRDGPTRRRVFTMARTMRAHKPFLQAVGIVAVKPG
ncbi:MAG TPA: methyltransferase domain-containing protein [Microbacteriaceae bacterium]|nr:methyltransferase domain-containing protein [Microbacteriaceae bacterium]